MRIEVVVNKAEALSAAADIGPDSIAFGDDACAIRGGASWNTLSDGVIRRVLQRCPELYLVTPQLLAGTAEVVQWARAAAELVGRGFNGLVINNLGLLEVIRAEHPALLDRIRLLAGRRISVYNTLDLEVLWRMGFSRATVNTEMHAGAIGRLRSPVGLSLAMLSYGPLSLAYSRMCYTMSMKGRTNYENCGIACERESLDLGSAGQDPVFLLYGREIQSTRRYCAASAIPIVGPAVEVLQVVLPAAAAAAEIEEVIVLLRDAAASSIDLPEIARREALLASAQYGLCNGSLFGRAGVAYVTPS